RRIAANTWGSSSMTKMTGSFTRRVSSAEIGHWKRHAKFGASRSRFQFNLSVMALDQPPHDVQPKSGTFAHGLCSKKGIEDPIAYFNRDPTPIINDPDHHSVAIATGGNFNLATFVYGIQRVVDEV